MLSGIAKFLATTVLFGSAVGGGSYGIVELVKSSNKKFNSSIEPKNQKPNSEDQILDAKRQEKTLSPDAHRVDSSDNLSPEGQSASTEKDSKPEHEKFDSSLTSKVESQISDGGELTDSSRDSNVAQELTFSDEASSVELKNKPELTPQEVGSDENKEEERQKEIALKQEQEEITNQNILLEAVWVYGSGSSATRTKNCFLLKAGESKQIPELMSEEGEGAHCDEYYYKHETIWSDNKQLEGNQEGLWIRGKNDKVREFLNTNKDDLSNSGFVDKNKLSSNSDASELGEIFKKPTCSLESRNSIGDWVEVTCKN